MNTENKIPPIFEEFQKDIEKLKNKYGDNIKIGVSPHPGFQKEDSEKEEPKEDEPLKLKFDYKPKDIKAYLDQYVIKQDVAKKALAIAVCDHYYHAMECERNPKARDEALRACYP